MTPLIKDGQNVVLQPVEPEALRENDIVLAKVKGIYYLHLIKAIHRDRVLIGNNHGRFNGWTGKDKVYGRVSQVY